MKSTFEKMEEEGGAQISDLSLCFHPTHAV